MIGGERSEAREENVERVEESGGEWEGSAGRRGSVFKLGDAEGCVDAHDEILVVIAGVS